MAQKNFLQIVKELSILIGIGVVALIILNFTTDIFGPQRIIEKQTIKETIIAATTTPVALYPEFDSLSTMENLILLSDAKSYTPNGDTQDYSYMKYIKPAGEFSKIYLYIEASFNNGKLTGAQDIYVKFNDFGGHVKNKPLSAPDSSISRLLYDADNIQYVETISKPKIEAVSWLDVFNDTSRSEKNVRLDVFISSREEALIEKMELYYQCARGVECSIKEVK